MPLEHDHQLAEEVLVVVEPHLPERGLIQYRCEPSHTVSRRYSWAAQQPQHNVESAGCVIGHRWQDERGNPDAGCATVADSPVTYHQRFSWRCAELLQRDLQQ